MPRYLVTIMERWARNVEVEAEGPEEAMTLANEKAAFTDDMEYVETLPRITWQVYDEEGQPTQYCIT